MDKTKKCLYCDQKTLLICEEEKFTMKKTYYVECVSCMSRGPILLNKNSAIEKYNARNKIVINKKVMRLQRALAETLSLFVLQRGEVRIKRKNVSRCDITILNNARRLLNEKDRL